LCERSPPVDPRRRSIPEGNLFQLSRNSIIFSLYKHFSNSCRRVPFFLNSSRPLGVLRQSLKTFPPAWAITHLRGTPQLIKVFRLDPLARTFSMKFSLRKAPTQNELNPSTLLTEFAFLMGFSDVLLFFFLLVFLLWFFFSLKFLIDAGILTGPPPVEPPGEGFTHSFLLAPPSSSLATPWRVSPPKEKAGRWRLESFPNIRFDRAPHMSAPYFRFPRPVALQRKVGFFLFFCFKSLALGTEKIFPLSRWSATLTFL